MASRDDDRFRVRPAPPKTRTGPRSQRFVSQVLRQASKAGANASGAHCARPASTFGRGRVAAGMASRGLGATARRVIIKSRFVVLKKAGIDSVSTHLRYLERDGVTRDGQRGQAYGSETDAADLRAFVERGKGDRHQFRFIVSVEDAEHLEDLRSYTRKLMQRLSTDLETRLDWIAVDHWDTDNPHTHIVLRGRAGNGQDLVIAPDYMAHGMRLRAAELATEWLGPRTELEIQQSQLREVKQERLTSLDRSLLKHATMGVVDLTGQPSDRQRQTMLRARLQRLEALELAERIDANHWRLASHMQPTLTAMGERGDILRTMQKALHGQPRDCVIPGAEPAASVIGRIVAKGLADELNDRAYLVVDGIDGRAHYLRLPAGTDLSSLPVDGIVEMLPAGRERTVDRQIAAMTREEGLYRTSDHLAQLERTHSLDPQAIVEVHIRRLEALRRAGIGQRVADGVWQLPRDFMSRAQAHDAQRAGGITIELRARLSLDQQVRAIGATWLDRQLVGEDIGTATRGFGAQVRNAMQGRADFLAEEGLAKRHGQRVILARNLLSTLRDRELATAAKAIQDETGMAHRPFQESQRVSGVYRRSIELASGRFAMLDDGMGFYLVPWRPVVEQRLGQHVAAVVRGQSVSWTFGRQRGYAV